MHALTVAVLLGLVLSVNGACTTCDTTYTASKTAAGSDKAALCTALKVYLVCLHNNLNLAACVWDAAIATAVAADFTAASPCTLDTACTCVKDFYATDPSAPGAPCTAAKALVGCIYGQSTAACGQTTTVPTMFATTNTYIKALSPACSVTSTCQCQIDYSATTITAANNCTTATTLNTCYGAVTTSTEVGCTGSCPQSILHPASTSMKTAICGGASEIRVASLLLLLPLALFKF